MSDISLLPDPFREKEEELKKDLAEPAKNEPVISMHMPNKEEEDVEIIEVDENEVEKMLQSEPFYSRLYYKLSLWGDELRKKIFTPRELEVPPKSPPQFFTPTKPVPRPTASVPRPASTTTEAQQAKPIETQIPKPQAPEAAKPAALPIKPKIIPAGTGKRIRIIKRVRKPVHVSLLSEQLVRDLQVNVSKRKFTLAFLAIFCATVFACAYVVLGRVTQGSDADLAAVAANESKIKAQISEQQAKWSIFQDLEPRLIALNTLLDKHVFILKLFEFLEQNTLKSVSYGNLTLDDAGKLSVSVLASDLPSAARQLMIFRESPEVVSVDATSFAILTDKDKSSISFQMVIQFKPEALRLTATTSATQ